MRCSQAYPDMCFGITNFSKQSAERNEFFNMHCSVCDSVRHLRLCAPESQFLFEAIGRSRSFTGYKYERDSVLSYRSR